MVYEKGLEEKKELWRRGEKRTTCGEAKKNNGGNKDKEGGQ